MLVYYLSAWALAVIVAAVAHKAAEKANEGPAAAPMNTEPEDDGTRAAVYSAYRGMLRQHASGLWRLTACLSQRCPAKNVALYALEETARELGDRGYNCKPIFQAIDTIKNITI